MSQDVSLRKKKPVFIRQDAHKKSKLGKLWRRPRGRHNKVRLGHKGYRKKPTTGWGAPNSAKFKTDDGKNIIIVASLSKLAALNPKTDAIVISRTLGAKKKLDIIEKAKGFTIINLDSETYTKKVKEAQEAHRKKVTARKASKKEKKVDEKKAETKKTSEKQEETSEEKKKEEKKEKDKILTMKE